MTKTGVAEPSEVPAKFEMLPIGDVVASKTNPRTQFNEEYLQQLAISIGEKGIIEPLIVRPVRAKMEIVAGECREPDMVAWAQALGVNVKACEPKKENSSQESKPKTKPKATAAKA